MQNKEQRSTSDVIIQEQSIPTVYVRDSEFENEAGRTRQTKLDGTFTVPSKNEMDGEPLPTRSTRTKTLRKNKVKETAETNNMDVVAKQSDVRYLTLYNKNIHALHSYHICVALTNFIVYLESSNIMGEEFLKI